MIAMIAWVFAVISTIWRQQTIGCAAVCVVVVMAIVVVGTMGGRIAQEKDPGNMTQEELEDWMEQHCW